MIDFIKEYSELDKLELKGNDKKIPKVIYRTSAYELNLIPYTIADLYRKEKELNKEYEHIYFSDSDCESFILSNYGEHIRNLYLKLIPTAFRADFFRYLLLYKNGGIYMDCTQQSLMPMDNIIKDYKEVYVSDFYTVNEQLPRCALYQAFIATVSGTKLLELAIETCIEHIETEYYGGHTLDITGPAMLGRAFRELKIDGLSGDEHIEASKINNDFYIYNFDKNKYGEYIVNEQTKEYLLKNKIDNHYNLTYNGKNNDKRYPHLWENRMVYDSQKNERDIQIHNLYKEILKRNPDSVGFEFYSKSNYSIDEIKHFMLISNEYKEKSI